MLDSDDVSVSLDSPQHILRTDCTIRVFVSFGVWITHNHRLQKYSATITIFISFYIKLIYYFSVSTHWVALHNKKNTTRVVQ